MKALAHTIKGAALTIAAAIPLLLIDPAAQSFLEHHAWAAAYLPLAGGILRALEKAKTAE